MPIQLSVSSSPLEWTMPPMFTGSTDCQSAFFLLQIDCDSSRGISQHGLCRNLCIGRAHVGKVCRLPAFFQLRGKHWDRNGDQYGDNRNYDQ